MAEFARIPLAPLNFPTLTHRRFRRAIAEMDAIVYVVINKSRDTDQQCLPATLMNATPTSTSRSARPKPKSKNALRP
ncbi:cytochrome P450 [Nocardia sp. NBC_01730]|uniref:hypothetical protein n=1 Tax=Nocardia sp. NBC_01730 TaxID=2975998 RepID=UPI002E0FCE84|nr:cytochrome P450 [Nocardia sp. NBC_01730]